MTVAELIATLSEYPQDMRVLRAGDSEWNDIYQIYDVSESLTERPQEYTVELVNEDDVEDGEYWDYSINGPMTVDDFVKVLVIT